MTLTDQLIYWTLFLFKINYFNLSADLLDIRLIQN